MSNKRDSGQLDVILTVYRLRKEKIKSQINQINTAIAKKKMSLQKLMEYANSYKATDNLLKTIQIIKNNQAFYDNLARVITTEKNDLEKLEKIKTDLISSYTGLDLKIDGLDKLCEEIRIENFVISEVIEDNETMDRFTAKTGEKNRWNR